MGTINLTPGCYGDYPYDTPQHRGANECGDCIFASGCINYTTNLARVKKALEPVMTQPTSPLDVQVGGNHYKDLKIQPVEYIHANNIGYMEGNVIKYVSRWRAKNGIKDLEKAKHYIELLIQLETRSGEDA